MTQDAHERRLRRLASSYNAKAARLGRRGRVDWFHLAFIEAGQPSCTYCFIGLEPDAGSFDHVVPLERGGINAPTNIVRCCYACQRSKFTKTPDEFVAAQALIVSCTVCGTTFQPRWGEWQAGRARVCSRRCAAVRSHQLRPRRPGHAAVGQP